MLNREHVRRMCAQLAAAERPVRILRSVSWPLEVKQRFLSGGAVALPEVAYPPFDARGTVAAVAQVRTQLAPEDGTCPVNDWLHRVAQSVETGARMLAALGTPEFGQRSIALYGAPTTPLRDESTTSLGLARRFEAFLDGLCHVDLGAPAPACHLAGDVAKKLENAVKQMFGPAAPAIEVVDRLSANALAGATRIRLRSSACFTDKDAEQLIHHEAFVHVATSLNGRRQVDLPVLAASHPGTTKTQEGLAVFAEFITGSMELDRFRRLAGRVIAIQMTLEGADFLDVYRFFLDRTSDPDQSFENARRVFRGGVITGGAPFTKDVVYLDGLMRVHTFLGAAVSAGRADCVRLLFAGKLDIEDIPAMCVLHAAGLCRLPAYLPPWASDLRFLLSHLAYSGFLSRVGLDRVDAHYRAMFERAPRVGPTPA